MASDTTACTAVASSNGRLPPPSRRCASAWTTPCETAAAPRWLSGCDPAPSQTAATSVSPTSMEKNASWHGIPPSRWDLPVAAAAKTRQPMSDLDLRPTVRSGQLGLAAGTRLRHDLHARAEPQEQLLELQPVELLHRSS